MTFEILSMLPDSYGRALRSYHIGGRDTIGVYGDEPYAIRLRAFDQPVSVKIFVDGTDITTAKPGEIYGTDGEKFMVRIGSDGFTIKTWFESMQGGSQLVFRHQEHSVAEHTHGNSLNMMGTIQVVYFIEGDPTTPTYRSPRYMEPHTRFDSLPGLLGGDDFGGSRSLRGGDESAQPMTYRGGDESAQPMTYRGGSASEGFLTRGGAGTGAGAHVEQRFKEVPGFRMPILSHVETISYTWWDDLTTALEQLDIPHDQFVGDAGRQFADLGSTPRPQEDPSGYQRFKPIRR